MWWSLVRYASMASVGASCATTGGNATVVMSKIIVALNC